MSLECFNYELPWAEIAVELYWVCELPGSSVWTVMYISETVVVLYICCRQFLHINFLSSFSAYAFSGFSQFCTVHYVQYDSRLNNEKHLLYGFYRIHLVIPAIACVFTACTCIYFWLCHSMCHVYWGWVSSRKWGRWVPISPLSGLFQVASMCGVTLVK